MPTYLYNNNNNIYYIIYVSEEVHLICFPLLHVRHHEPSRTAQGGSTRVTWHIYFAYRLCLMTVIWTGSQMNEFPELYVYNI